MTTRNDLGLDVTLLFAQDIMADTFICLIPSDALETDMNSPWLKYVISCEPDSIYADTMRVEFTAAHDSDTGPYEVCKFNIADVVAMVTDPRPCE